jgi:geranylgeranyl pyrophosphate synthase
MTCLAWTTRTCAEGGRRDRVYGSSLAAVTSLVMVPLAVECALDGATYLGLSAAVKRQMVCELMRASGAGGMIGGQWLDIVGGGAERSRAEIEHMHHLKTGALIRAALHLGGLAGRARGARLRALDAYGAAVGLAFQIADDVLDVNSSTEALGKSAGADARHGKTTHARVDGVQAALARAEQLASEGRRALIQAGILTPALDVLSRYAVARQR